MCNDKWAAVKSLESKAESSLIEQALTNGINRYMTIHLHLKDLLDYCHKDL